MWEHLTFKSIKWTDLLGCVGSAVILLFASALLPVIGPVLTLFTPLPFIFYATKLGRYDGLKIILLTILLIGLVSKLAGFPQMILLCIEFGLLGFTISEIFRRNLSLGLAIFWGTGVMLLIGAVVLIVIGLSKNMGPIELIVDYFKNSFQEAMNAYEASGSEQEDLLQIQEYAKILSFVISRIYPSLMVVGTGFVVWSNIIVSRGLFRFGKLQYPDFGPMDRWSSPEKMVWVLIISGFAFFLPVAGVKLYAINIFIIIMVIYVFHGLSILLFFFKKYNVPPWIRAGVYILLILQQFLLIGLCLGGLFDQWLDIRKIHPRKNPRNE